MDLTTGKGWMIHVCLYTVSIALIAKDVETSEAKTLMKIKEKNQKEEREN